jgi:hypothetical protein
MSDKSPQKIGEILCGDNIADPERMRYTSTEGMLEVHRLGTLGCTSPE